MPSLLRCRRNRTPPMNDLVDWLHHLNNVARKSPERTVKNGRGISSSKFCMDSISDPQNMERVAEVWRDLCRRPSILSAFIHAKPEQTNFLNIELNRSYLNIERNDNVSFTQSYVVDVTQRAPVLITASAPVETKWSMKTVSPSGQFTAVLLNCSSQSKSNETNSKAGENADFIEVWNNVTGQQECCVSLKVADKHGKVHCSVPFGSLQWSYGEGHLLYVAEKKVKATSYFDPKYDPNDLSKLEQEPLGDEFVYKENFGEKLSEVVQPVLCIMDVPSGSISVVENIPVTICPAYAIWTPDDTGIVFAGFDVSFRKLGPAACMNRKCPLYYYDLVSAGLTPLCPDLNVSAHWPLFTPDVPKKRLFYLEADVGGPHMQCFRLKSIDWNNDSKQERVTKTVVDKVARPASIDAFPGIFLSLPVSFPQRNWLRTGSKLYWLLESHWKSRQEILVIDTDTGCVSKLPQQFSDNVNFGGTASLQLLDVCGDMIFASCSSPNVPPVPIIGNYSAESFQWTVLGSTAQNNFLDDFSYSVLRFTPKIETTFKGLNYESILQVPKRGTNFPLIVVVHGGPHASYCTEWLRLDTLFGLLGYALLKVNYRGSTGFGEDSIRSLPGNCGTLDVSDVQHAVETVLAQNQDIDRSQVFVFGGSHGGFIAAHLIGQYPGFYMAAAVWNGVMDVAAMCGQTDIPDWNFCEGANLDFKMDSPTTPEQLKKFWEASPIRYVEQVRTPVLALLGGGDIRVPPLHSREYFTVLKARGQEVRILFYPNNNHGLQKVDASSDAVMNIVNWFEKHHA